MLPTKSLSRAFDGRHRGNCTYKLYGSHWMGIASPSTFVTLVPWQKDLDQKLLDLPIAVYNPRRPYLHWYPVIVELVLCRDPRATIPSAKSVSDIATSHLHLRTKMKNGDLSKALGQKDLPWKFNDKDSIVQSIANQTRLNQKRLNQISAGAMWSRDDVSGCIRAVVTVKFSDPMDIHYKYFDLNNQEVAIEPSDVRHMFWLEPKEEFEF